MVNQKEFKKMINTENKAENDHIHCSNPWNDRCQNTDIVVYIYAKGKILPICKSCWNEIADSDLEW